jgi:hypothetical protein
MPASLLGRGFVQITMTSATEFEGSVAVHLEFRDETVDERNHFTGRAESDRRDLPLRRQP